MFQLLMTVLSGVDFVHHAAGIMDPYSTISPEKIVLEGDRLAYINQFQAGYEINEEPLVTDLIGEVEAVGHFVNQRHTLEHSKGFHRQDVFYRDAYDNWEDDGATGPFAPALEHVQELQDVYERPRSTMGRRQPYSRIWRNASNKPWKVEPKERL